MEHHPVFSHFAAYPDPAAPYVDWIGMRYRPEWWKWKEIPTPIMPLLHQDYFEWVDLLAAVSSARGQFAMLELGAGFGRWGIRGALAARQRGLSVDIRFVEAEPQHAAWLRDALELNGLGDSETRVIEAVASPSEQPVPFLVAAEDLHAANWYGQAEIADPVGKRQTGETYFGRDVYACPTGHFVYVEAVSLERLISDLDSVDLVDMDIQGAEQAVVEKEIDVFSEKVRMVHIGTHSVEIEAAVRSAFHVAGWTPRWDFSLQGDRQTPFGPTRFGDGIQSWLNPRFS